MGRKRYEVRPEGAVVELPQENKGLTDAMFIVDKAAAEFSVSQTNAPLRFHRPLRCGHLVWYLDAKPPLTLPSEDVT